MASKGVENPSKIKFFLARVSGGEKEGTTQVLGGLLAPFWDDFPVHILKQISMRFFLMLVPCPTPQTIDVGALARARCDFSSFRKFSKKI